MMANYPNYGMGYQQYPNGPDPMGRVTSYPDQDRYYQQAQFDSFSNMSAESRQPPILCRMVRDERDILARDVPMDRPSMFLKDDRREVYLRFWDGTGSMGGCRYVRADDQNENKQDPLELIMQRLDRIESALGGQQRPSYNRKNKKGGKYNEQHIPTHDKSDAEKSESDQ